MQISRPSKLRSRLRNATVKLTKKSSTTTRRRLLEKKRRLLRTAASVKRRSVRFSVSETCKKRLLTDSLRSTSSAQSALSKKLKDRLEKTKERLHSRESKSRPNSMKLAKGSSERTMPDLLSKPELSVMSSSESFPSKKRRKKTKKDLPRRESRRSRRIR